MTPIQPPAVLLMGAAGAGKTDSIATLLEAGLETFVIVTEADGIASLLDSCFRRGIPTDRLHWTTVLPAVVEWSAFDQMVNTITMQGYEDITKIKSGVGKSQTREPAMRLLRQLSNFHCEHCGKEFGDVAKWGPDRALVLDSLSGLSLIAMALTIGFKPAAHQGEWGVAMNFVEQLLLKLTGDRRNFLVITAHIEREMNEITGTTQIMASTLGRKLAPKIPRNFSEVVYAKRHLGPNNTARFTWSTVDVSADLKNRSLPISSELQPTFVPVVENYRKRVEFLKPKEIKEVADVPERPLAKYLQS